MIRIQGSLNRKLNVACSGGVDSMAVVDFLLRNHDVNLMFFDHGTETSKDAREFLLDEFVPNAKVPEGRELTIEIEQISRAKKVRESWEEYWRNERYKWFYAHKKTVITCHHLDDCVETWIWSSLHGNPDVIHYRNNNVIRPFRLNRKQEFINWCRRKYVKWIEDVSNEDTGYMRNYIRHEMIPKALVVNPGLHTVIRKKVEEDVL